MSVCNSQCHSYNCLNVVVISNVVVIINVVVIYQCCCNYQCYYCN